MFFAIMMFGEPGAEIMYPNPGFPIYESMIKFTGAKAVPIELLESTGFAFDPDRVLAQITPNTRLIIINTPANPTGNATGRSAESPSRCHAAPQSARHFFSPSVIQIGRVVSGSHAGSVPGTK